MRKRDFLYDGWDSLSLLFVVVAVAVAIASWFDLAARELLGFRLMVPPPPPRSRSQCCTTIGSRSQIRP